MDETRTIAILTNSYSLELKRCEPGSVGLIIIFHVDRCLVNTAVKLLPYYHSLFAKLDLMISYGNLCWGSRWVRVYMEEQVVGCTRFMISFSGSSCRCVSLDHIMHFFSGGGHLVFSFQLPLKLTYTFCT